ncbi:MAG: hypothetical protein HC880_01370 [Bacteroidia bacterium]|nr:hypothetical protein [Bacteroidia bacterium]
MIKEVLLLARVCRAGWRINTPVWRIVVLFVLTSSLSRAQVYRALPDELPKQRIRHELSLNGKWQFKAASSNTWAEVTVPHTYQVSQDTSSGAGGLYRRAFYIPPAIQGMQLRIWLGGVFTMPNTFSMAKNSAKATMATRPGNLISPPGNGQEKISWKYGYPAKGICFSMKPGNFSGASGKMCICMPSPRLV